MKRPIAVLAALLVGVTQHAVQAAPPAVIAEGARVSLEMAVKLLDGTVIQQTTASEPLVYTHGNKELLPALEKSLTGLAPNATLSVTLKPEEAYGRFDNSLIVDVPPGQIPEASRKVDAVMIATDPSGVKRPVRVQEVRADKIVLDFNHPLAGQAVQFDVKILGIQPAATPASP